MTTKRFRYLAEQTPAQDAALSRLFGCVRVVTNDTIAARRAAHEAGEAFLSGSELSKRLVTQAKTTPERAWLGEVSAVPLQQALQDVDRAYRNFFRSLSGKRKGRRVGAPRFKSRRDRRQSARFTKNAWDKKTGIAVEQTAHGIGFLTLPKVGRVRFRLSRPLPSAPSSVTVIREADGRVFLSFVVDVPDAPLPHLDRVAGVDLGLIDLAAVVYSDGTREKISNPRHLQRKERALARAQRALARKEKGSQNQGKTRKRVAVLHRRVRETRLDAHHKFARRLVNENQVVAVEGLSVAGLARTKLARSVHDAAWGTLLRLLEEKAASAGRTVTRIGQWEPTTQTCSVCGTPGGKKPLHIRAWKCEGCGNVLDRDWNAAVNVMVAAGLAETLNACGGDVRRMLACAVAVETGTHRTTPVAAPAA